MKRLPTRRQFLGGAALLAGAAVGCRGGAGPSAPTVRGPRRFIDGLCLAPTTERYGDWVERGGLATLGAEARRAGLAAFLLDVSTGERVDEAGHSTFRRTYRMNQRSIRAATAQLTGDNDVVVAARGSDIDRHPDKVVVFFQIQGCEPLEGDLDRIAEFHREGLRVLQLTHHHDNSIAGGALQANPRGLTRLGREAIAAMNAIGLVPDLSHASIPTALETLELSKAPVIVSHGAARALVDSPRCLPDEVIRAVAESGGVMGIFMMSMWLTTAAVPEPRHYVDQLRHVINAGGIEAVGVANDFPLRGEKRLSELGNDNACGVTGYQTWWKTIDARGVAGFDVPPEHVGIPEFNHLRRLFTIERELERSGFSGREIDLIMGLNWQRVLTESLG